MAVALSIEDLRKLTELIKTAGGADHLQAYLDLLAQREEKSASSPSNQKGRRQAIRQAS